MGTRVFKFSLPNNGIIKKKVENPKDNETLLATLLPFTQKIEKEKKLQYYPKAAPKFWVCKQKQKRQRKRKSCCVSL